MKYFKPINKCIKNYDANKRYLDLEKYAFLHGGTLTRLKNEYKVVIFILSIGSYSKYIKN